jgi:hypothetical protein
VAADHETVTDPLPTVTTGATRCGALTGVASTAAEALEEAPPADSPFTVKLYLVPPVIPVIVQLSAVVTQVKLPAVTVYFTAATREESVAIQEMVADPRPGTTDAIVGVAGVALRGVQVSELSENDPEPLAFPAATRK